VEFSEVKNSMMGEGKAEYKVPGGKMVKVNLLTKNETILDLKISGDFFMYPEEAIFRLESHLKGKGINSVLPQVINEFLRKRRVKLLGITAEDLAEAIYIAYEKAKIQEIKTEFKII
jgi:lipoate-protein ligase A